MASINDDLIGEAPDADQLLADLHAANTRIDAVLQALRLNADCLGRIAAAAGVLDFETLDEMADGVIERLNNGLTTPPAADTDMGLPSEVSDALACVVCGAPGATDLGDGAVLCDNCSGANALAAEGL